jgi:hypothetical protein
LPMNDTGYTFVIVLVIVWYLFRLVSRDRLIASGDPSKVFLVIGICGVEGDCCTITNAFNAIYYLPFKRWFNLLIHFKAPH